MRHLRKIGLLLPVVFMTLHSCKTANTVTGGEAVRDLSARQVIKRHYRNAPDFKTVTGRMKVDYSNGDISQGVNLSFRIRKDEAIWLSATMSLVKVYITPDRASFYNKLDNTYFDGDFSYLSHLLGTELNFGKIQDMLLGQAMLDLTSGTYTSAVVENTYQLMPEDQMQLFKALFRIEPAHFRMGKQLLTDRSANRALSIEYKKYQEVAGVVFPEEIDILAQENDRETSIRIAYRNMELNRKVSFPYSIPKGYREIKLEDEL
ncbi:DUF4292 domain-containing protein [Sinomicrobium soli]|uniref:DUF4292 domain-containing protein n=1 Tax=Sinomicrobium sp. N-1-3-6 TaxID=2219864 RepID=UPI000DCD409B|nr:DUF4292 domain-containing protein [Sinomicrobium sp. N-1-3-6]RAV29437.1 DUF4292 domain-containing protein [Sinomicrobium sp. N-1-3-6]